MPCINLDLEYFSHRKVLRLCAKLGPWAEIIPLKLWAYTGKFHPENGLLIGYSADELVTMIGVRPECNKDASSILQALQDCGFLIPAVNGWEVHQWLEYQGHIAAFSIRGKTAAKARWSKFAEKDLYNASGMLDAMLKPELSNAPTNYPTDLPTNPTEKESPISSDVFSDCKPKKEKPIFSPESEPMEFADLYRRMYADWTKGTGKPPTPQKLQAWAGVFDAMMRIDGHSSLEIERMLNEIDMEKPGKDGFAWKHVLLSPEKIRLR